MQQFKWFLSVYIRLSSNLRMHRHFSLKFSASVTQLYPTLPLCYSGVSLLEDVTSCFSVLQGVTSC